MNVFAHICPNVSQFKWLLIQGLTNTRLIFTHLFVIPQVPRTQSTRRLSRLPRWQQCLLVRNPYPQSRIRHLGFVGVVPCYRAELFRSRSKRRNRSSLTSAPDGHLTGKCGPYIGSPDPSRASCCRIVGFRKGTVRIAQSICTPFLRRAWGPLTAICVVS